MKERKEVPALEVNIRGDPNEIAVLVLAVQGRQDKNVQFVDTPGIPNPLDTITESLFKNFSNLAGYLAPKCDKEPEAQSTQSN